ncbi:MAG: tripartite tricarboxylate transporter substrate binding protein [Burkholderiales bacterium]|nr:tripartite tricarboxylate transporter substrate binding protein [Burkholderiales bacterium]
MKLLFGLLTIERRTCAAWVALLVAGWNWGLCAWAAEGANYPLPGRRIVLVVPFAPGGSTDLLGRLLAEGLSRDLGVPVVVDNRPGAGTGVAAEFVARSSPDGYTLLLGSSSTFVFNPLITPKLRYDPDLDFAGVTLLASAPMVLLVPANSKAESFTSWVQRALTHPGQFNFGSPGRGSTLHLAFEQLMATTGIRMVHIPYRGSQPALNALASGEIDAYVDLVPTAKAAVDGGLVRALGVLGDKRSAAMPAVPTLAETGGPALEVSPLFALMVPASTPKPIVQRLNQAASRVLDGHEVRDRLRLLSFEIERSLPEQVMPRFKADRLRWERLIRDRAIVVDP